MVNCTYEQVNCIYEGVISGKMKINNTITSSRFTDSRGLCPRFYTRIVDLFTIMGRCIGLRWCLSASGGDLLQSAVMGFSAQRDISGF